MVGQPPITRTAAHISTHIFTAVPRQLTFLYISVGILSNTRNCFLVFRLSYQRRRQLGGDKRDNSCRANYYA